MADWEWVMAVCLGVALAAACGFRVFLPLFAAGLGKRYDLSGLEDLPTWVCSPPALAVLGVATVVEICAYFVPWVDHALDAVASPLAVTAGILVFAGINEGFDPIWRWALALVAGGGSAAAAQTASVATRALSTGMTGGLANPIVAAAETAMALVTSVAALVFAPCAIAFLGFVLWRLLSRRRRRSAAPSTVSAQA